MKILYISQFFNPENVAGAFRAYENSKIWNENGHETTIFTTFPNYPLGKIFNGYEMELLKEDKVGETRVLRSKVILRKNVSKLDRIIYSISFMLFGVWNFIFNKKKIGKDYDFILGSSGPIFSGVLAYIFSKLINKPFIIEFRDIGYVQMLAVYSSENNVFYKIMKKIELFLCKKATKVIVVTEGFREQLINDGIEKEKILKFYNGFSFEDLNIIENAECLEEEFIKEEKDIVISFFGNIGKSQDLLTFINVFEKIKYKNIKLLIIGDGAEKSKIIQYIEEKNIKNIIYKSSISPKELEKYYKITDLGLVSLKYSKYLKDSIPSKLFHIMARKKAVIFIGPKGETSEIIKESKSGIILNDKCIEKNIYSLNKLIETLNKDKSLISEMGINGYQYCLNNFDRKTIALEYINEISKVINSK